MVKPVMQPGLQSDGNARFAECCRWPAILSLQGAGHVLVTLTPVGPERPGAAKPMVS